MGLLKPSERDNELALAVELNEMRARLFTAYGDIRRLRQHVVQLEGELALYDDRPLLSDESAEAVQ